MVRLFIAVTLPEQALLACGRESERVREALGPAAKGVRFARAEGLHFTLKFLGSVTEEAVDEIVDELRLAASEHPPFELALGGLRAFPNVRRPRVIFIDVTEGAGPLGALAASVERRVAPLGFPSEKRPFAAHVTLGRIKEPRSALKVGERFATLEGCDVARFRVEAVTLMRSQLSPGGSRYTPVAVLPLRAE